MPPFPPLRGANRSAAAMAQYKRQGLARLSDAAGLSRGTGDAVQSFGMGATGPLKAGEMGELRRGIEAWHGSPRKFDQFDPSLIGSGDGSRAFGHGLSFTSERDVADKWRQMLGGKESGATYRVNLDVAPDEIMEWDYPVTRPVAERLKSSGVWEQMDDRIKSRPAWQSFGSDVMADLVKRLGKQGASDALNKAGIKGMAIEEQGPRAVPNGATEYLIFAPERVKILERLAAMGLTGEALVQAVQQMSAPQQKKQPTGGW